MRHLEDSLQMAVAKFLALQYPDLLWWHTPNGGKRNAREAGRLKAMGVRPGVADLLFIWKLSGNFIDSGAIELKAGKNALQESQKDFQEKWIGIGGHYALCRSLDEVMGALESWGVPKGHKCPTRYAVAPDHTVKPKRRGVPPV